MTTNIQLPTPTAPPVTTVRGNLISLVPPRRPSSTPETPIMHAWSIGTTRIAQERPAQRRKEECPPEVYIG